jgi:hypothetical protein
LRMPGVRERERQQHYPRTPSPHCVRYMCFRLSFLHAKCYSLCLDLGRKKQRGGLCCGYPMSKSRCSQDTHREKKATKNTIVFLLDHANKSCTPYFSYSRGTQKMASILLLMICTFALSRPLVLIASSSALALHFSLPLFCHSINIRARSTSSTMVLSKLHSIPQ